MKKILLLAVCIALACGSAMAAACAPGTLASYIALVSSGCVLGNLTVSNFAYQAKFSGGAAKITADQINVTPLLAPTGTYGLQFSAPWDVQGGQSQSSDITYDVLSASTAQAVQQVRLDGSGMKAGLDGSVLVNEALATPTTTSELKIYLKCDEVCQSQTSAMLAFPQPLPMLIVSDQVTLQAKMGPASMSNFADWFVTCPSCV